MKENKTAIFDVRTLLFLDMLIMVFMLISGKAEVTLCSFIVAAAARRYPQHSGNVPLFSCNKR